MKIFSYLVFLSVLFFITPDATAQVGQFSNIEFVENKGQWNKDVLFRGEVGNGFVFLTKEGITVLQYNQEDFKRRIAAIHNHDHGPGKHANEEDTSKILRYHVYKVALANSKLSAGSKTEPVQVTGEKPLTSITNYIKGNSGTNTTTGTGCRSFQAVTYSNVYDSVDMRFYSDGGQLKYDFIVKPGGRVSDITLRYDGLEKLSVKNNQLNLKTTVGSVTELYPYTYQLGQTERADVACKYVVKGKEVSFKVSEYNKSAPLVIDPSLIFSTYAGSRSYNWGFTATYGPDGSFYGGGIVFGADFPVTPGAYQTNWGGAGSDGFDIGIIKLDPLGRNRIYATFIGGNGEDQPHSLVVDAAGNLIIAGRSNSPNFPLNNQVADKIGPCEGWDIILVKLNATGTAAISTKKIGGKADDGVNISAQRNGPNSLSQNYGDDARSEVVLDRAGNIYLASCTRSDDFFTQNAFASTLRGEQDAVVLKFNPDMSTLLFSTYLGGTKNDAAFVIAENPVNGNIYVAGATESDNITGRTGGVQQNRLQGSLPDGFVAEILPSGNVLERFCYYGTTGIDIIYGLQFDKFGFPYIMGTTTGTWPMVGSPGYGRANAKQFVSKLRPDLTAYVYSTTFGSDTVRPNISPTAFLVDRCENLYVSGWGGTIQQGYNNVLAGTTGLDVTPDAYKPVTDGKDFYFIVIKRDAASLLYGSFFGQTQGIPEHVDGGTSRFDASGTIYQAVCANCQEDGGSRNNTFPTTAGSWSPSNPSNGCNLGMIKIAFDYAGVAGAPRPFINGVRDSTGCIPMVVEFRDSIRNAVTYEWNFGDGSPDVTTTTFSVNHTYTNVGTYVVRLIAIDPASCNVRDTSYTTVRAGNNRAVLAMNIEKLAPCELLNYRFDNLSTAPPGAPFGNTSFIWDFGDNTARIPTSSASVTHSYASPGTYNVKLILNDTSYCNSPDSLPFTLRVNANVVAQFETPFIGCAPYDAVFNNTTLAGQDFLWDFGDGQTSDEVSPVHRYDAPGRYRVVLIAIDSNTCNITDTTELEIEVFSKPTAAFTYTPVEPEENTPTQFFNNSSLDAVRFKWLFGDGDSLITIRRDTTVRHQYNSTGTFQVSLIAYNAAGCTDTARAEVRTIVLPLVDVPSAFVPQGDARANTVYVVGFGISKMKFRIFNRFGQLVFESNDRRIGWNGTYKGAIQPMDVYAYTLEVEFFDGTKRTKKGDITLIR